MRSRVDRLGVAEPEIRTQGDDQISIQLPGVDDPAAAANIIGKTAQLELFDLEKDLVAPSIDARTRQPIATAKLYDLLAGQQALAARGDPESYYVFQEKGKKLVRGPVGTREAALAKWDGKLPKGHKLFAVPPNTVVVQCGRGEVVCPGVGELNPTTNSYYLFRYTPPEVPEMTGKDLNLDGTRQDFDTTTGEPIVLMDFTDKGAETFERITRDVAQRGRLLFNTVGGGQGDPELPAALRDRARPRDQVVADDRLRAVPGRDLGLERRADLRPRRRRRGEGPGARPPDGRASRRVPDARPDRHLGDARQGLARGGEARGARRPPGRRASSCSSSTASWGSSRSSA